MRIEKNVQLLLLPGSHFVVRQWFEEPRLNRYDATQCTERSFRGDRLIRHEPRNRVPAARQHDFLTALHACEEA